MLPDFDRRNTKWAPGHSWQSAFFLVIDPARFAGTDAVETDVASLMTRVAGMSPFPGFDEAALVRVRRRLTLAPRGGCCAGCAALMAILLPLLCLLPRRDRGGQGGPVARGRPGATLQGGG